MSEKNFDLWRIKKKTFLFAWREHFVVIVQYLLGIFSIQL